MARHPQPGRREDLLLAGQQVLGERGIARATIDEVTAAAGVAKGTFYLYFESKNDLIAALRRQFADELAAAMTAQTEAGPVGDWFVLARRQLESAVDAYLGNAPIHEVLFHPDARPGGPDHTDDAWPAQIIRALTEMIRRGVDAGAFAVGDPELTAALLFHALHGLLHQGMSRPEVFDRDRVLAAAWNLVRRTLSRDPAPPRRAGHGAGRPHSAVTAVKAEPPEPRTHRRASPEATPPLR